MWWGTIFTDVRHISARFAAAKLLMGEEKPCNSRLESAPATATTPTAARSSTTTPRRARTRHHAARHCRRHGADVVREAQRAELPAAAHVPRRRLAINVLKGFGPFVSDAERHRVRQEAFEQLRRRDHLFVALFLYPGEKFLEAECGFAGT